jgi:hypothetical protein
MSKVTISLNRALKGKGQSKVSKQDIAQTNMRISLAMKNTVRNFQKNQKTSLEKASQIVLNA